MPATYQLIASNTLSSAAASVTFSSIPATYTDLVVRMSVRSTVVGNDVDILMAEFNGNTSAIYSNTYVVGFSASASSGRDSNQSTTRIGYYITGAAATANTFSSSELYIPSYTASQNKPMSGFSVAEKNTTETAIGAAAGLFRTTTAISSIKFTPQNGTNFASGSSFFLYGIKNS
jgi:hypothetical protein